MALFSDGLVSEISDLTAYESDLPSVATAEDIDLPTKLLLAQTEVGAQLEASSRRPGNVFFARGAGWQSTGSETSLPRFDLRQVVVTQPLKLWHTFQSLSLVYRDAQSRQLSDKYLPKWREYQGLSKWASELLFQTGVGLVTTPVPRPLGPQLTFLGATSTGMSLFVRVTWVAANGEEGAGSPERAVKVPADKILRVTTLGAPAEAAGWNVYLGKQKGQAFRQNAEPLELDGEWLVSPAGATEGPELGEGQSPEAFRTVPRFLQRG